MAGNSQTMTVQDAIKDKDFIELPAEEKRKVLSALDKDFAGLPTAEQDKVFTRLTGSPFDAQAAKEANTTILKGIKEKLPTIPEAGRMALQATGGIVGGAVGAASPVPGGTAMGGILGFGIAQQVADKIYQDRPVPKGSSAGEQAWDEIAKMSGDLATGAMYEMAPWGMKLVSKVELPVSNMLKEAVLKGKGWSAVKKSFEDYSTRFAEKRAGQKIAEQASKTPIAAAQIEKNIAESTKLEQDMPGMQFNLGQKTGDPALLSLSRATAQAQTGPGRSLSAESTLGQNKSIQDFIKNNIVGPGDTREFVGAVTGKQAELAGLSGAAKESTEQVARRTGSMEAPDLGPLLDIAQANKTASSRHAAQLYNNVPMDLKVEGSPLFARINEMFDDYNQFTQRISATPTGAAERMKKVFGPAVSMPTEATRPFTAVPELARPGGNRYVVRTGPNRHFSSHNSNVEGSLEESTQLANSINADNIRAFEARQTEAIANPQPSRAVTVGELKDFRTQMGKIETEARAGANGDYDLARKAGNLKTAVNDTLELAAHQEGGAAVSALREATDYWRDVHVPKFRHGITGKILTSQKNGEQKIMDSAFGREYFKGGEVGVKEAAQSFDRTFGNNPEARGLIRDYAAHSLLKAARKETGDISSEKMATWMADHAEALRRYGLQGEFTNLERVANLMDDARGTEAAFNKSSLAKAINNDPDKVIPAMFMQGTNKKQSIGKLTEMVNLARRDTTGAALDGLRAGIGQELKRISEVSTVDLAKANMASYEKVHNFLKDFGPAMRQSGLYTQEQMRSWTTVHNTLRNIAAQKQPTTGYTGPATADLLATAAASATAGVTKGIVPGFRTALKAYTILENRVKEKIDHAVAEAVFNPEYAEIIMNMGSTGVKQALKKIGVLDQMTKTQVKAAVISASPLGRADQPQQGQPRKTIGGE